MRAYDTPYMSWDGISHSLKWDPTPQEVITRQVADTIAADRDKKITQALIDLGWTPPATK